MTAKHTTILVCNLTYAKMNFWFCLNTTLCTTFFLSPTGKPKLFFVSVKRLQGLGKLNVLVQTADTFIQAKKPDNINSQIRLLYAHIPITEIWVKF
jgi:hypothetical protein